MLAQQGKLSLDDNVRKYIPELPEYGTPITIRHLLNHTSGIKSYTSLAELRQTVRQDVTPAEILGRVKDLPLEFAPGGSRLLPKNPVG